MKIAISFLLLFSAFAVGSVAVVIGDSDVKSNTTTTETVGVQVFWNVHSTDSEIAGFRIHYGRGSREYDTVLDVGRPSIRDDDDGVTAYHPDRIAMPTGSIFYLALTVYNHDGLESDPGPEIKFITAPTTPKQYRK